MVAELNFSFCYILLFLQIQITNPNMELNKRQSSFDQLIDSISQAHYQFHDNAQKSVNLNLTLRNWLVGYYIVEYEQKGEDKAKYGDNLIGEIASQLKQKEVKGFSVSALKNHRTFYQRYPQIRQSVIGLLQSVDNRLNIRGLKKSQSLISQFDEEMILPVELILSKLTYTHFIELFKIEDPLERLFYEVETIKNNWSVRDLKRATNTSLAFRTSISTNKEALIAKVKSLKPTTNFEILRDPYILEFLGLEDNSAHSELDLEQAILTHLQKFLVELGTGFCFEARQKRITFDNTHYRIDLVFYHRILKSHVLVDLKIGEFTHADAGQMTLYLNYFKAEEMTEGDNPPIGIILCADKNDTLVKYTTANMEDQLFVSKYLLKLPDKKILENIVKEELKK